MAQGVLGDSEGWGYPVGPRCYDQHLGLNLAQAHADEATTKMRAEAAEAKVVLVEWNTPESICPDTKEAIRKWCFETSGNDADIAALQRPNKFPRWNYKWKLSTYPASGGDGTSEPDGESAAPPRPTKPC